MLKVTTSDTLLKFLNFVETRSNDLKEVGLVAPYLEFNCPKLMKRWHRVLTKLKRDNIRVVLITKKSGSNGHLSILKAFQDIIETRKPIFIDNLHAKLYMAIGKERCGSLAILTSANFTQAAIQKNIEASLYLRSPMTDSDRILFEKLRTLYISLKNFNRRPQHH